MSSASPSSVHMPVRHCFPSLDCLPYPLTTSFVLLPLSARVSLEISLCLLVPHRQVHVYGRLLDNAHAPCYSSPIIFCSFVSPLVIEPVPSMVELWQAEDAELMLPTQVRWRINNALHKLSMFCGVPYLGDVFDSCSFMAIIALDGIMIFQDAAAVNI